MASEATDLTATTLTSASPVYENNEHCDQWAFKQLENHLATTLSHLVRTLLALSFAAACRALKCLTETASTSMNANSTLMTVTAMQAASTKTAVTAVIVMPGTTVMERSAKMLMNAAQYLMAATVMLTVKTKKELIFALA